MKGICLGAMVAAALCLGGPARAASNTTLGVGSGAVAGALVGGPIGAVAGAIVGGVVGSSTERPRRYRRARMRRSEAPVRSPVRAAEERRAAPAATGSVGGAAWRDPR